MEWRPEVRPWEVAPISRGGSIARYLGCLLISALVWSQTWGFFQRAHWWVVALDLLAGVVTFALVSWRRRRPLAVALVTAVIACASATAAGPATLAALSVATRRRWPHVILVGLATVVSGEIFSRWTHAPSDNRLLDLSVTIGFVAALMSWGMYMGSRRELLYSLKERAEQAEAQQELRTDKARGDERARIAREMHDVLAHRISQVSMLAGALSFRTDLTAEQMREHAGLIQSQANQALDELRAVLGVLRDRTSGELMDRPQPTWADVPALLAEARVGGTQVTLDDQVIDAATLSGATGRTAYRMVQEAVTNARKHAPGAVVRIEARGGPDEGLALTIRNPLGFGDVAAPGSGLGLVGLAERAALSGGTLEHGRERGEFVLKAWLPWTP